MIELVVFVVMAGAVGGLGIVLGMILAGRIDRLMSPPAAEPPTPDEEEP